MRLNRKSLSIVILIIVSAIVVILFSKYQAHHSPSATSTYSGQSTIPLADSTRPQTTSNVSDIKSTDAYRNPRTDIDYANLFRNADSLKGTYVKYEGKVIQAIGEPGNWNLRVNITKKLIGDYATYDDTVFISSTSPERLIEKDIITFTALANGTITYDSTFGSKITVPALAIFEHTVIGRSDY